MLPATLAHNVRRQIRHYLEATFNFRRKDEEAAFGRFVDDPANGLFKGPWVQLRRPFRPAPETYDPAALFDVVPPFHPFRHQWQAWLRLSAKRHQPETTIVTTGTGSGKTECFMYPVLDHALRAVRQGQRGIKTIILYPMNALAADQAGRFAEEIFSRPELHEGSSPSRRARVRVGLFTGRDDDVADEEGGQRPQDGAIASMMVSLENGREHHWHITDRQAMLDEPPDILLTNYKMLDYLLMKPKYRPIWRFNEPGRLGYLVLDELHTYDGAQGADVGCLIRRLKARLDIAKGGLCCVGTSATIAGGNTEEETDPLQRLAEFAGTLFEENVTQTMIISEEGNRLTVDEMVDLPRLAPDRLPTAVDCTPQDDETASAFARRVAPLFGAPGYPLPTDGNRWAGQITHRPDDEKYWGLALGQWLRGQDLFKALLDLTASPVLTWDALVDGLADRFFALRAVGDRKDRDSVVAAFFALVAQARQLRSGRALPLVPTQVQIWVRELRRLGRVVKAEPEFGWLDERKPDKPILPVAHCTECGESAWVALIDPDSRSSVGAKGVNGFRLLDDPTLIYQGAGISEAASPDLVVMSPWYPDDDGETDPEPDTLTLPMMDWYLAPDTMVVRQGEGACPISGARSFRVKLQHEIKNQSDGKVVGRKLCPHCGARDSLMFIGSRAATMASVAIDEMFGSVLNSDPKLLAFTDSVQDASHRAGFFSARTYHFTFRTALQRVISEAGREGLSLTDAGNRLLEFWSQNIPGRPGSMVEAMGTLLPPDLREYGAYIAYRDSAGDRPPPPTLQDDIARRLTWEAVSEFGLMLTHGRTLEQNASACLGWDAEIIEAVVTAIRDRLPGIDPALGGVEPDKLRLWLLGLLQRQRELGGLSHPFVAAYARGGLWGKKKYGRIVEGRETYPLHGKYVPRLLSEQREGRHTALFAVTRRGAQQPWPILWARRALGGLTRLAGVSDVAIADLHKVLLQAGTAVGLFERWDRKDGKPPLYAIAASAARLCEDGYLLVCDRSGHALFRPSGEAAVWEGAPSLIRSTPRGRYRLASQSERQNYYRARYRKGALRRVFAQEHTGLLTTQEREELERRFNGAAHADDPNVITATSTLEMGIDIGDLSTTMLCSVPPTTASYLQRIGRAGRTTGTALVVSVINQRPHDLFFFARPEEMLSGSVEPPGCWLDASAMLTRQYLAYCIDRAVKDGLITGLPSSGKRLIEELERGEGSLIDLLGWMVAHEAALHAEFLSRFGSEVRTDTRDRFHAEAETERLLARIREAADDFGVQIRSIEAARRRLNDERREIAEDDAAGLKDIERELRILRARMATLNRMAALEVLTEHGLLPNYAFPERGVRLAGTVYKDREGVEAEETAALTIDITRAAAVAIRELAPGNTFYTHGHQFDIQQLAIGTQAQPLIRTWAVCGKCGHMRPSSELEQPGAAVACPQCGYDRQQQSQVDRAQWKPFLHFAQSGAISYMEYYDSLSGDRAEEREKKYYRLVYSFDQVAGGEPAAVGTEDEPFGLEYRSAMILRQINTGPGDAPATFEFGPGQKVPELGFPVCQDCGVVAYGDGGLDKISHRKSCAGRKRTEKAQREGRSVSGYKWQRTYLYRELKSEAIRVLLPPDLDQADISTLRACLFLGLRLHFHGYPGHLLIEPQVLPDHRQDVRRQYLVLMDAVPGGTGFLKSLFVPTHDGERAGEGIIKVLRLALDALESCDCRLLGPARGQDDTDGCYRCLRAYHLQYKAEEISRERGIVLLRAMIEAGERRVDITSLDDVELSSLYGSVLEKKFVDQLQATVLATGGSWAKALVKGASGFRFRMGGDARVWEVQLQPKLGPAQGVAICCQPDFLLSCDDAAVRPIAVFTDGFEFHAEPHKSVSRLPDDAAKRRAILASGRYWVWSITWNDLVDGSDEIALVQKPIRDTLHNQISILRDHGTICPPVHDALGDGFRQLTTFLRRPDAADWARVAGQLALIPLTVLAGKFAGGLSAPEMATLHDAWCSGQIVPDGTTDGGSGQWYHATILASSRDLLVIAHRNSIVGSAPEEIRVGLRLGDSESERTAPTFSERWRRWLGLANLFQFAAEFHWLCISETLAGTAPELSLEVDATAATDWSPVMDDVIPSLQPLAARLAAAGVPLPSLEVYLDTAADDCFAELAWPEPRVCLLVGDQLAFRAAWESAGWTVVAAAEIQLNGVDRLVSILAETKETV